MLAALACACACAQTHAHAQTQTQTQTALYLRALAASCAQCHGTEGRGGGPATPRLAGRPRAQLASALQAFRAGTRQGTVMPQIARGYSEAQLAQLAAYFSRQR